MKILLLGSTGRTGKLVLVNALEHGYQVNCLARHTKRIALRDGVEVFEGNPTDENDLSIALEGCEAIVSVLNISRKNDFPWSKLITPKNFLSDTMRKLVPIATSHGVNRVVVCSAWGVGDSRKDMPIWFKWLVDLSNIGYAYQDHERQENILAASGLDWTIVRPTGLNNHDSIQQVKESFNNSPKPSLLISRKSLANYLVSSLTDKDMIHKKVVVSKS